MREEDLLEEPDRATRVLSLKEEWETPSQSQNEATKEDGEANSAEKSKQLTAKQKEKLAKKAKYKNMTKSKSAGQVCLSLNLEGKPAYSEMSIFLIAKAYGLRGLLL